MITVRSLVKTYTDGGLAVRAVDGIDLNVAEGEFYTLLGPSGCGKTTTLRCVAGLERPNAGSIELAGRTVVADGRFVPTNQRDIGMVFQSYAVWPHMTVFENVAFPLRVAKTRSRDASIRAKVEEVLELVGLAGYGRRMSTQLSGGQRQRLSLARALVREPSVLLLDEPLSNLDAQLRERMRTELSLIQRRLHVTTLFVTHDQAEALAMSDRVAVMNDGRIVQEGTPREIYHSPVDKFVARFIGTTNLIDAEILRSSSEGVVLRTPIGQLHCAHIDGRWSEGDAVVVAIRPEEITLRRRGHHDEARETVNVFPGLVELGLFGGAMVNYQVAVGDSRLSARVGSRIELERGHDVLVAIAAEGCRILSRRPEGPEPTPGGGASSMAEE